MAVLVATAPPGERGVERCVVCRRSTGTWWGEGCAPLCEGCAVNVSHSLMVKISRREHLGPIPKRPRGMSPAPLASR